MSRPVVVRFPAVSFRGLGWKYSGSNLSVAGRLVGWALIDYLRFRGQKIQRQVSLKLDPA